ncbi:MAG TPA: hypothetical protein VGC24_03610 [Burkholderiaceae bacterium]
MIRCLTHHFLIFSRMAAMVAAICVLCTVSPVSAQYITGPALGVRDFPAAVLRGTLMVTQPPAIMLDGEPDRLSPGARIYGTNNLMVLSSTIADQSLVVNYLRDTSGLVHQVWLLTAAEAAQKRPSLDSLRAK